MVELDPATLEPRARYRLLTSLVVPRPIAWVSTLAPGGGRNLAPHSYFNVISSNPAILHFTSVGEKDTLRNVRATGEFVVNVVSVELLEQMNRTAADFPAAEDEFAWAGVEAAPSRVVAPPRVAAAPAALECRLDEVVSKGDGNMVFGAVVFVHVADGVWADGGADPRRLDPIGRLGGAAYLSARGFTELQRPRWSDLRDG